MKTELKGDDRRLSCGHTPSPHSEWTTGTAWVGSEKGGKKKEICWDCSYLVILKEMKETGKCFAYLSSDGKSVTTWPGQIISDKVRELREWKDNFGGERTSLRFLFEGEVWSGMGMGRGMYLRARRTKLKAEDGL